MAEDKLIKDLMIYSLKGLSGYIPGARRFHDILWRDYHKLVNRKRIRRYMKEMGLVASMPCKDAYKGQAKHDHPYTAPENLVQQGFKIKPRKIICTDITYLYYGEHREVFYLCVFKDAFTREILGYSADKNMTVDLIKSAYEDMMNKHGKEIHTKDVLIQSDQGSQFLSTTFEKLLEDDEILHSVSARANSQDNAPVESFFAQLKTNLLLQLRLCKELNTAIGMTYTCINEYNTERYQYELGGLTPEEYYQYVTTGIYPCESYYGKTAPDIYKLSEIVSMDIEKREERAAKRRERNREFNRVSRLKAKDPYDVVTEDIRRIEYKIRMTLLEKKEIEEEINSLQELLANAQQARAFIVSKTPVEREQYKNIKLWQQTPQLNYIYDMRGMF